jgi:hypothetical protein
LLRAIPTIDVAISALDWKAARLEMTRVLTT